MPANYREYPFVKGRYPRGWTEATVGDVVLEIQSGFSSGKHNQTRQGIPHLRPMSVSPLGEITLEGVHYIAPEAGDLRLAENDVLFTNTSSTAWVGKTAVVRQSGDWAFSNHMTRVRVGGGMDPEFIARQLHYLCMCGYFAFHCKKHINQSSIANGQLASDVPFRCPPAEEQMRITAKLSRLLERERNLREGLQGLPPLMEKYRAAVIEAACTGRLVPTEQEVARKEGREFEPAIKLIQRVSTPSRPNRFGSRNLESIDTGHPALTVGKPSRRLPKGWTWVPLVDVARMESGHTPSRNHPEWWEGDIPWVGILDARVNHGHVITQTAQHTNPLGLANSAARLLPTGTVCVSRTASVGYVVVLGTPMATSQDFVNWVPTEAVLSGWLKLVFMASRERLARFGKGAIHTTIYFQEWLSMHIALPPLAEQQRIVGEVGQRLATLEKIEQEILAAIQQTSKLRSSLFHHAFAGKMVGQSVKDKSTSLLIIAIASERKAMAKERGKKVKMKKQIATGKRDLLEILAHHPEGLTPERLLAAAGYSPNEVPDFYQKLREAENEIEETRPSRKMVVLKRRKK